MSSLRDFVHADPWAQEFVDLPSLNEAASDAILRTISHVRRTAREDPASLRGKSIVVLGPAGAGKTHLFTRLRRSQGPKAVFVHVRPLIGAEMTPRYVLLKVVEQLGFETQGLRQADALVGSLVAHLKGHSTRMPRTFLHDLEAMSEAERETEIDSLIEQVIDRWPQVDEAYLRKLLQLPFSTTLRARALLSWLSGREPDEAQLARIGVREGLREDLVVAALKTIGAVAAPGAPIVIVFDQLENLVDADGANRVRAYGNLIAELVDEIRGVVLVQMALDSEWARAIEPELATSQKSRAAMDTQTLALPTSAQREALLRLWSERLPGHAPFPAPFGAEHVQTWREAPGLTPRMLLVACLRALDQGADAVFSDPLTDTEDPEQVGEAVGKAWSEHLALARLALDQALTEERCIEAEALADGWSAAVRFVPGMRVLSTSHLRPAQIVVERNADRVHVALLNKAHPRSLLATMDALARVAERDQVLVVRELSQPFKPTWRASIERRDSLLRNSRVQWLDLPRDDVARLLALRALIADARSRDVTDLAGRPLEEEVVRTWVELTLDVPAWMPLRALQTFGSKDAEVPPASADRAADAEPPPRKANLDRASSPKLARGSSPSAQEPTERAAGPDRPSSPRGRPVQVPAPETVLHTRGEALLALSRLHVASVDRLVREVMRAAPTRTRRSVVAELRSAPSLVRWFGGTLVAWKEDAT